MYEKSQLPLASARIFLRRILYHLLLGLAVLFFSLGIGMAGYAYYGDLSFVDSYLNASMILSGMGPIATMTTTASKVFAGTYALFSGIIFLVVMAVVMAPVFHRFFHAFVAKDKM